MRLMRKANDAAAADEPIVLRLAVLDKQGDPATLLIEALVAIAIGGMRAKRSEARARPLGRPKRRGTAIPLAGSIAGRRSGYVPH